MAGDTRREFLRIAGTALGATLAASSFPACVKRETFRMPNIVFLFSDDQSVPDLGCYGNPAIHTPHLDQMAADGIRFNRGYVASPQCSPSRASVLTGRTPHDVNASRLHAAVPENVPNIVQLLKKRGYYTGAFRKVHQPTIQDDFDYYGGADVPFANFFETRPAYKPFFLWFGSTDPHRGYGPGAFTPPHDPANVIVPDFLPDTPEVRQDLAYYYDEIARFDKESGEILQLLEEHHLAENTMIVMAGDNGLPFPRAKATLYEPGINVPLLIKWPGVVDSGRVTDTLVSLTDLAATWLEAAGIDIPDIMQSHSLVPFLAEEAYTPRPYIFAERNWHDNWDPTRCIVSRKYKLIQNYRPEAGYLPSLDLLNSPSYQSIEELRSQGKLTGHLRWYARRTRPEVEFYDLEDDPGEWNNLAEIPGYESLIQEHQLALSTWMKETHDFLPPPRGAFPGGLDSKLNRTIDPLNGQPYKSDGS